LVAIQGRGVEKGNLEERDTLEIISKYDL